MILRDEHKEPYAFINQSSLRDKDLSLAARGLLAYVLTLADDWKFSVGALAGLTGENESKIKKLLQELKDKGYLTVERFSSDKTQSGRFEYVYIFSETKIKTTDQKPYYGKPPMENHSMENHTRKTSSIRNTNIRNNNKEISKKEISNISFENKNKKINSDAPQSYDTEAADTEAKRSVPKFKKRS